MARPTTTTTTRHKSKGQDKAGTTKNGLDVDAVTDTTTTTTPLLPGRGDTLLSSSSYPSSVKSSSSSVKSFSSSSLDIAPGEIEVDQVDENGENESENENGRRRRRRGDENVRRDGGDGDDVVIRGKSFTPRAVLVGLAVGLVICFSNMYFGLQTGWVSSMTMPASLLGFGIFRVLLGSPSSSSSRRNGLLGSWLSSGNDGLGFEPVENVLVQTVAGSMAIMPLGCGFVGVLPAMQFLMREGEVDGGRVDLSMVCSFFSFFFFWERRRRGGERGLGLTVM